LQYYISILCLVVVGLFLSSENATGRGNAASDRSTVQVATPTLAPGRQAAPRNSQLSHGDRAVPTQIPGRVNADARSCVIAIAAAETRYGIPAGLLQAIAKVESGRSSPATGELEPWPWSINVSSQGMYFSSREQAVQHVRRDQVVRTTSIDAGCLQVNLQQHPAAFATLTDAFDPVHNADYAARFLLQLWMKSDDWRQAVGHYHSRTPALAAPYRIKVERLWATLGGRTQTAPMGRLQAAWAATLQDRIIPIKRTAGKPEDLSGTWQGSRTMAESLDRRRFLRLAGWYVSAD
jgi:hypothetical protein